METGRGLGRWNTMPTCLRTCTSSTSGSVNIMTMNPDRALDTHIAQPLIDAVDAAQQGRLAAARGADEGGDEAVADRQIHVEQGLKGPVPEIQFFRLDGVLSRSVVGRLAG